MKLQHAIRTPAAVRSPDNAPDEPPDGLLDSLGDFADERVLLLGPDIGLMCALIRHGCLEVTELDRNERPEAQSVGVVIVASVTTPDAAVGAVARARRALVPSGRILLRTGRDPSGALGRAVDRALRLHGFSLIRTRRIDGVVLVSAELPLHGPLPRAVASVLGVAA